MCAYTPAPTRGGGAEHEPMDIVLKVLLETLSSLILVYSLQIKMRTATIVAVCVLMSLGLALADFGDYSSYGSGYGVQGYGSYGGYQYLPVASPAGYGYGGINNQYSKFPFSQVCTLAVTELCIHNQAISDGKIVRIIFSFLYRQMSVKPYSYECHHRVLQVL